MKSVKDVEKTRRDYHRDRALNSVHRSSLTVPELPKAAADISLLNHFLIKRGIEKVGCRVTAVDPEGQRIESRLHQLDEPRVYHLPLTGMVDRPVATYLVEFFTADNLFIPFPAVMVNHHGKGFLNSVHSYNRILNDVFEDDAVNSKQVSEASIDVHVDARRDTFAVFTAGPQRGRGTLDIELASGNRTHRAEVPLDIPRLTNATISLKRVLPDLPTGAQGTLKIRQPAQSMFYGRMLAGTVTEDGSFSANHSYYDSSDVEEYWDDARESVCVYPLFDGIRAAVRAYPIMSPGELTIMADAYGQDGANLGNIATDTLVSPGGRHLEIPVSQLIDDAGLGDKAASFAVRAAPTQGKTPTRIAHQVVYGDAARPDALEASISVGLTNPNVFVPSGKTGLAWGQLPIGGGIESWLGIVGANPAGQDDEVIVTFYGTNGMLAERRWPMASGSAVSITPDMLTPDVLGIEAPDNLSYVWFEARSNRPDLKALIVSRHRQTGNCTGEHSF